MKKIIIFLLTILILCGCNRNVSTIDFEVEPATEEPTTNAEVITGENLLQAAMLNEIYISFYYSPSLEKTLFKDEYSDMTHFSVVDVDFDGQNEVVLYEELFLGGYHTLFLVGDEVTEVGIETNVIYEDGYIGGESEYGFWRKTASTPNQEGREVLSKGRDYEDRTRYRYEGKDITPEEFEVLKKNFSTTPVTKYELTEENIRKYVK